MAKQLTIIGGTGHLSTRVVGKLIARGAELTLVARNPQKARDLFGDAVTVVRGDVSEPESLRAALEGAGAIYIHLNTESVDASQSFYTEREGVRNIVAAAEAVGAKQLIQIAGIEALRPDFFNNGVIATAQIRSEGMAAIRESSIPHTFLTCSFFLDSLPRFVADGALAVFADGTNRIHFTSSNQLADHLFHVADNPDAYGKTLPVQGVEGLEFGAAAERFFSGFAPEVQVARMPLEAIGQFGLPEETAAFLQHVWDVTAGLREEFIAADVHASFGAPQQSLEAFAAELRAEAV